MSHINHIGLFFFLYSLKFNIDYVSWKQTDVCCVHCSCASCVLVLWQTRWIHLRSWSSSLLFAAFAGALLASLCITGNCVFVHEPVKILTTTTETWVIFQNHKSCVLALTAASLNVRHNELIKDIISNIRGATYAKSCLDIFKSCPLSLSLRGLIGTSHCVAS